VGLASGGPLYGRHGGVTVVATLLATETYQSDIHADDLREQELVEPGVTPSARP
jgi:hypothetical protein